MRGMSFHTWHNSLRIWRLVLLSSTMSTRLFASSTSFPWRYVFEIFKSLWDALVIMVNVNVEPSPSTLSARMCPPISSTNRILIARPRPVPPYFRVVDVSTCENGLNRFESLSAGIPMPVSFTAKRSSSDFSFWWFNPTKIVISPLSVNLTALPTRL